jgi:hypothetical protein
MADVTDEFSRLMDSEFVVHVVVVLAAYMVPTLLKNTIEGRDVVDLPDEVYGVVTVLGSGYLLDGEYRKFAGIGGGVYTVEQAAERVGIKGAVEEMGA